MIIVNGKQTGKPYLSGRKLKTEKELQAFLNDCKAIESAYHRGELSEKEMDEALLFVKKIYSSEKSPM